MRVAFLGILLCALAGVAQAQQPSSKFLTEYNAGVDAFRLGKYDEAKTHLEAAKAIDASLPGPWRFLAAVAQAEGDWPGCVASAREALRLNPSSGEAPATRKLHDDCRTAWGKPAFTGTFTQGQGGISITSGDQTGATVEVNGLSYGATPVAPRVMLAGDATVSVTKPGYLPNEVKVIVVEGLVIDVDVPLEVDPNATHTDVVTAAEPTIGWVKVVSGVKDLQVLIDDKPGKVDAQGRFEVDAGAHVVEITAPGHEKLQKKVRVIKGQMITVEAPLRDEGGLAKKRKTGGIFVGGGIAMLAVGAVTAMLSLHASDQARDEWAIEVTRPASSDTSNIEPIHTRADIDSLDSRSRTFAVISDISYGVAAVAIVIGAYELVKGRPAMEVRW